MRRGFTARTMMAAVAAAALGAATLTAAPAASGQLPGADAPGPAVRYTGEVTLSPDHGSFGTPITVTGAGLPRDVRLSVRWHTVRGSWVLAGSAGEFFKGRRFEPVTRVVATPTTDGRGGFTATFRAPMDFGFFHDVTVVHDGMILNQAGFRLDPHVSISPASGPVGTPVTVVVHGIGYQYLYNVWQLVYDNKLTGWLSSVTTQGTAVAVIPATGAPGPHLVQVLAGIPSLPYLNTQQSPTPDRPTFTRIFTITKGRPVLPPPAEAQGLSPLRGGPSDGDGATLWVDPRRARVGARAVVRGRGFPPGHEVQLAWFRVVGNRMSGQGWAEDSVPLGTARAAGDGSVAFPFSVPDDLGGPHRIVASVAGRPAGETRLVITPSAFAISPASGPVGTVFTIRLKGGGWTETANIYTLVYDNAYLGYACSFNSQGDITIQLPAAGEPGWHFIELYPAIYKGEDIKGVENLRIPQLTYADHPGEKLPAFRFAFLVTR